ncbi:MAG TPA: monovalent cation:proton antiporter-2 (CPA2) family protein [Steroidobacteraceae bacterium]|jgi:glutathione-regulated potassium-efflux system ancillary protein KefC/glutathione-regulated potassium-efflux system protein KefB|nr:monovalent cation:proton antiporter-2 (CPA2) family protein [Steroidobacteraceae bacterium]
MISLAQTAVLLAAAVLAVSLFRLLNLSSILGYVAAGLVIGPWGLRLIHDIGNITKIAEFGVVLLLFIIGLELQPTRLWVMRRLVFGLGAAQVALCTVLLGVAGYLVGLQPETAAIVGFGLSLSSTPLVLQVLAERGQLKSQHGRSAFGILLFQDLAVLPVLAILPLISHTASTTQSANGALWPILLKLVAVVAVVIIGGRLLLRPALRVVARVRVTEVFTAAALLTVIATALLANLAGLSMSLGAFLAGVLLADSEFRHELEADIEPFKGLLLGLFFIVVGMSANLGLLSSQPLRLLGITAGLILIKLLAVTLLGRLTNHKGSSAWRLGFTLPAGGEFAFVLFTLATHQNILDTETADLLILAVTLSMMLGPLLLMAHDIVESRWLAEPKKPFDDIDDRDTPVIIAGFGRFGQIVARILRLRQIPFTALDSNQTHVDFVRRFGNQVYYGDASRLDLLRAAGAETAKIFVLAIDDVDASIRTAQLIRAQFPKLKIFARARNRQHSFALMDAGVTHIIRETLLSSLDLAASVLQELGETQASARGVVRKFRQHDEATLAAQYAVKEDETKFRATTQESAKQLEKLFETDEVKTE